jgi:2',3'-cyclic-nucleotide 2'-phosphodiesterase (5'-nucleotidase family)
MTRYRWIALGACFALGATLLATRHAQAQGEEVLTILHTNDLHGHVLSDSNRDDSGPGGLARLNTMATAIRKDMPNVLYLDAGDNLQATPTEFLTRGRTILAAMNSAGFDASTLGNHEFDWNQDATTKFIRDARFPVLAANVRDRRTNKPFGGAREYVILQRGPVKVAVLGLSTTLAENIEWPPTVSNVRWEDPVATAKRLVPELREKADIVVALTHLGVKEDNALAAAVPGIDVIIGGHSHTALAQHVWVGNTVIAQTGAYGRNLGRMDLLLQKRGGRWGIASVNGKDNKWWADTSEPPLGKTYPRQVLLPVAETVAYDPAIVKGYQKDFDRAMALMATPIGHAPKTIVGTYSGTTPRALPATFANLLRTELGADVGLMPSLGENLPAGPITVRTIYDIYGGYTRQNLVLVRASGAAIREAVLKAYAQPGKYPTYFAGLNGTVTRQPDGSVRWDNPAVNGLPLDENGAYLVASGAYPLMEYPTLLNSPLVSDDLDWVKPTLARAIQKRHTLTAYPFGLTLPPPPPTARED